MRLSWSQAQKYMSCPAKWNYEYKEGLRSDYQSEAMRRGSLFHKAMEAYFMCDYKVSAVRDAIALNTDDNTDYNNVFNAFLFYKDYISRREVVSIEHEFIYPYKGHDFVGFTDAIFLEEDNNKVIVDWKYRTRMQDSGKTATDGQLLFYAACTGANIIEMWQFNSKIPQPAKINKNGYPSVAPQMTTFEVWWNSLPHGHNLNKKLWEEKLEGKLKPFDYFLSVDRYYVGEREKTNILDNMASIANAISTSSVYPRIFSGNTCGFCSYRHLCSAWMYGEDDSHLREELS